MIEQALKKRVSALDELEQDNTHFHHQPRHKVYRIRDNTHPYVSDYADFVIRDNAAP
jgi:hypothetical protein